MGVKTQKKSNEKECKVREGDTISMTKDVCEK